MDTPDKKIQPTPSLFSKFEDSPVFNYLSTLSPIKPFKVGHSGQPFPLFHFASPQSSLTSPLPFCPKDSKITRAILLPDEPNNCSQSGIEGSRTEGIIGAIRSTYLKNKEVENLSSGGDANVCATGESSKLVIELPKSLKYDSGSPENNVLDSNALKVEGEPNGAKTMLSSLEVVKITAEEAECLFEGGMGKKKIQKEKNQKVCEWEKFNYEASDVLSCGSGSLTKEKHHEELDEKCVNSRALSFVARVLQSPSDFIDDTNKMDSGNHGVETPLTEPVVVKVNEASVTPTVKSHAVLTKEVVHHSSTETDNKEQKVTRRRCLVYEMSGTHYRKLLDNSPISKPPANPNINEKGLVATKLGSKKFSSLLPGIGLHLNALAAQSKDKIIVKRRMLTCRRQLINSPCAISSIDSPSTDSKPPITSMTPNQAVVASNEQKDEVQANENACQSSTFGEGIQLPLSSPKKKRRKSENVGDAESCKRCNCKRSKCLKLYCECFAAGLYCVDSCSCQDCLNKPIHEETVLETRRQIESRNPLAFAPKVIRCSTTHNGDELKKTPASARHKRGCNCKKSGCLKKYCECFQGGVGCSMSCRCEGCKNTFGHKEGIEGITIFEEGQMLETGATNASSYHEVYGTDVEYQEQVPPEASKRLDPTNAEHSKPTRQPLRRPFLFDGLTSQLSATSSGQNLEKLENRDQSALEEDPKVSPEAEDETLEVLKGEYLLLTCVKSASPNCKRVSPPHYHDFETSPGWRSCRKLILRSVPAFPALTLSPDPEKNSRKASFQEGDLHGSKVLL